MEVIQFIGAFALLLLLLLLPVFLAARLIGALRAMKYISWSLLTLGVATILFGVGSFLHYYAVNPPLEAFQSGWDADAHAEPYIFFHRLFWTFAGGTFTSALGFYMHGKIRKTQRSSSV